MIRCKGGSLYTGITNNLQRRFAEHQEQGEKCAKYLRGKGPLKLVYSEEVESRQEALKQEINLKQKTIAEKVNLVSKIR